MLFNLQKENAINILVSIAFSILAAIRIRRITWALGASVLAGVIIGVVATYLTGVILAQHNINPHHFITVWSYGMDAAQCAIIALLCCGVSRFALWRTEKKYNKIKQSRCVKTTP